MVTRIMKLRIFPTRLFGYRVYTTGDTKLAEYNGL